MYAFNWALTAFRSESYIGSATALPDTVVEATSLLFVEQHVKGAIIVDHMTPLHGKKWPLHRMIVKELRQ